MSRQAMRAISAMVALGTILAASVGAAAPVSAGVSRSSAGSAVGTQAAATPAGAKAWLGRWQTNFGALDFHDVYLARSETPDVHGKPQYFWKLVGIWAGHGSISGSVSQAGFPTFGGCWKPPDRAVSCGRILIYRSGNRITGGYWKPCRTYCVTHHPWSGVKTRLRQTVGYKFTQRGLPDGHRVIRTQTGGAGAISNTGTIARGAGPGINGSRMFHIDEITGSPLHMTIVLGFATWERDGRRVRMELRGMVDRSEDPRVPRGSHVAVNLLDGRGVGPDQVRIRFWDGQTHQLPHEEAWTSTDPQRVNVQIGDPRATT